MLKILPDDIRFSNQHLFNFRFDIRDVGRTDWLGKVYIPKLRDQSFGTFGNVTNFSNRSGL